MFNNKKGPNLESFYFKIRIFWDGVWVFISLRQVSSICGFYPIHSFANYAHHKPSETEKGGLAFDNNWPLQCHNNLKERTLCVVWRRCWKLVKYIPSRLCLCRYVSTAGDLLLFAALAGWRACDSNWNGRKW
jgi:hypothetical protein